MCHRQKEEEPVCSGSLQWRNSLTVFDLQWRAAWRNCWHHGYAQWSTKVWHLKKKTVSWRIYLPTVWLHALITFSSFLSYVSDCTSAAVETADVRVNVGTSTYAEAAMQRGGMVLYVYYMHSYSTYTMCCRTGVPKLPNPTALASGLVTPFAIPQTMLQNPIFIDNSTIITFV